MRRALDGVPPGSGAVVMSTGIVSTALLLDGVPALSRVLFALTAAIWVVLAGVLLVRLAGHRERVLAEARSPAGLTGAAGTAVLGARAVEQGWTGAGLMLLALAFATWAALMPMVLRRIRRETQGTAFMVTVATEGVAVLSASAALAERSRWLVDLAIVLAGVGLLLYPSVLVRFDLRQLRVGRGDHWVAGGALAICALALAEVAQAAARVGTHGASLSVLQDLALAAWAAAVAWLPLLVLAELRWPRPRYDSLRWATVFPLGMYAACSFSVGTTAGIAGIGDFASAWVWVAVVGWLVVSAGLLRTSGRIARRATPTPPAAPESRSEGSTMRRASYRRRAP